VDYSYYIVSISSQAFFNVVTSSLEAYSVCHSDDQDDHSPIETYGNLWGYEARTKRKEKLFQIVHSDVDTSATRTQASVSSKREAFELKEIFVEYYYPELEYLGDFHSHPYDVENDEVSSVLQLEKSGLQNFSEGDFKNARYLQKEEKRNYRVGIVTTIYQMGKCVKRKNMHIGEDSFSCIRFMHGDMAIWVKAYVFYPELIPESEVALICPVLGFHAGSIEQQE
jgi:hypothetical protein